MQPPQQYLDALVELIVGFGADIQPGQVVNIDSELTHAPIARAVAEAAYRRGAKYVDTWYFDPHQKHSRLAHADRDTLGWVPPWLGQRLLTIGELHGARIWLYGDADPHLMDDLDPTLLGLDIMPRLAESMEVVGKRLCNWTVVPVVTPAWAQDVFPELGPEQAYAALWDTVAHVCRLNEPDPVAAWQERFAALTRVAGSLQSLALDSLHFEGPGTDLTVGLLPGSKWVCADMETAWGHTHHPNLPSEEVFSLPDPARTEGYVTATKPLLIPGAAPVTGLRVTFEGGRAVRIEADRGAELLESMIARDDGACRLGEVALVDRESRVGQTGKVFSNILLDENAASHIALGNGYTFCAEGEETLARMNRSGIHVDFMIGSDEVSVTGTTRDGRTLPLLRGGEWQL